MNKSPSITCIIALLAVGLGCQSQKANKSSTNSDAVVAPVAVVSPVVPPATPASDVAAKGVIRIKAGVSAPLTDAAGNVWLADQGFEGGDVIERPDLEIANTKTPELYRAEHYSMDAFGYKLPNGKYQVKLHFAETFDGISGPGERVFSFNVEGQEFKDFDVFKKAGGLQRAYVETVNVEILDGKLDIKFTTNIENPEINAIEIIPLG